MNRFLPHIFSILLVTPLLFSTQTYADTKKQNIIRMATTTSTQNSGLTDYLIPVFEKKTGYKMHVIAVGTGKALRMGREGDVDLILVHALNAEKKFVRNGFGVKRYPVMYNDFVLIGPKQHSKKFNSFNTSEEAFSKIADLKSTFVSRGDDSGTHKKELSLWKTINFTPDSKLNSWYLEAGQGMGKVLQMAGEMDAFTLTDRGTWLAYKDKSPLVVLFEGDPSLFNPYGIIAVNPKKYPNVNNAGANAFIEWITSKQGQNMIGKFTINDEVLFTPTAISIAEKKINLH